MNQDKTKRNFFMNVLLIKFLAIYTTMIKKKAKANI